MTELRELIGAGGPDPDEDARLLRAHELLVRAGAPPELPPDLAAAPRHAPDVRPAALPLPRRGLTPNALTAAALAAVAFGAGFLAGNSRSRPAAFPTGSVALLHAPGAGPGAGPAGRVLIAPPDAAGNRQLQALLTGLPALPARELYELWLTRGGVPLLLCGVLRARGGTATVRFTIPYDPAGYGWALTALVAGAAPPGRVVLAGTGA